MPIEESEAVCEVRVPRLLLIWKRVVLRTPIDVPPLVDVVFATQSEHGLVLLRGPAG